MLHALIKSLVAKTPADAAQPEPAPSRSTAEWTPDPWLNELLTTSPRRPRSMSTALRDLCEL